MSFFDLFRLPKQLQWILLSSILIIFLIILVGGGVFVYTFINNIILEPIRGGRISALALIVLGVFVVLLMRSFGRRDYDSEWSAEQIRQSRRRY